MVIPNYIFLLSGCKSTLSVCTNFRNDVDCGFTVLICFLTLGIFLYFTSRVLVKTVRYNINCTQLFLYNVQKIWFKNVPWTLKPLFKIMLTLRCVFFFFQLSYSNEMFMTSCLLVESSGMIFLLTLSKNCQI